MGEDEGSSAGLSSLAFLLIHYEESVRPGFSMLEFRADHASHQ